MNTYIFASNNLDDLTRAQAPKRITTAAQRHFKADIALALIKRGYKFEVKDALGQWDGGSEPSTFTVIEDATNYAKITKAAAEIGYKANQKGVLLFTAIDRREPEADHRRIHSLWVKCFDRKFWTLVSVNALLDELGASDRTLILSDEAIGVAIWDPDRHLAEDLGDYFTELRGFGEIIGGRPSKGETYGAPYRTAARKTYLDILRAAA